jgi:chlorobactene glucosyltransferase
MIYQIIVVAGLCLFLINLLLNLKMLRRPTGTTTPDPAPLISVLIPARDEEENIEACLTTLQQQDYPNFEVLVLDDNSTDKTAELVDKVARNDTRIRLIRGGKLPPGWAGKPFACYQLARNAVGEWLLFIDADTLHAPHMLRSVLSLAIELNASLLSGFPRQVANSLPQKIAIPVLYFVILSWFPIWWLQMSRKSRPSLAIGQFLLFPKEAYWKIGGHKAVKSRILEDVWLGVEINRSGGRHVAVDLSRVFSCNMYHNLRSMWQGFVKWMYSVASLSPVFLVAMMIIGYIFYLAPFYWLWNELFAVPSPTDWRFLIFAQIILILLMRWIVDNYFKESTISFIFHPIGFSYLFMAVIYGCFRQIIGKGVAWKERVYEESSGVK